MPRQASQHMHGGFLRKKTQKPTWLLSSEKNTWFLALARSVPADAVFDSTGVVVKTSDG